MSFFPPPPGQFSCQVRRDPFCEPALVHPCALHRHTAFPQRQDQEAGRAPPPSPVQAYVEATVNEVALSSRLQIFMHGNNLNSLHQLIHPEILPSELGGMMPPYDMGTWARALLEHAYDEETDYCPESYTLSVQDLERDLEKNLSPKTMKRSVRRHCPRPPPGGARSRLNGSPKGEELVPSLQKKLWRKL